MKTFKFVSIAILTLTLQSCFFVAGAAAGAAAIAVVYDHRNVDSILEDQKIAREVLHKIQDDPDLSEDTHISVTSFGQVVLLTGEVPTAALRQKAEELTRSVRNVKRVFNAITIQGPTSSLTHASDAWITTKIKTEMLATKGLKSASIKVVTENGTVYLMGTVTRGQERVLIDIARHTNGVQKVVKIFQYKVGKDTEEEQTEAPVKDFNAASVDTQKSEVITKAQDAEELKPIIASE